MRRLLRPLSIAAVVGLLLTACSVGDDPIVLEASFEDVIDLVEDAPVMTSNVEIGTVTGIELSDDQRALVTMEVEHGTGLPSEVRAVLRQTSLLGERYVELEPVGDAGGELASGTITETDIQTDLEQLVQTGSDLLAFVAADRLGQAVQAGAVTFAGRAGTLGSLISDVEVFVGTYDSRSDDVTRLLDGMDALLTTLAQESETNAEALEALARANEALQQEDDRLLDALSDLRDLGDVGGRILAENRRQFDDYFAQLREILDATTRIDGALSSLLDWLPRHNLHVPNANYLEFVQIWQDTIMCGSSAEQPDNPSASCNPPNPGESNDPPPEPPPDACDEDAEGCRGGHRTRNEPNDYGTEGSDGGNS